MKRTISSVALAAFLAATLASCATRPEAIDAAYVSPTLYANLSCTQLREEAVRVSAHAVEAMGIQDERATRDAVAMGVGLILFWPAIFFVRGGGTTEAEIARLKGEMEAIEQASVQKSCGIVFQEEPVQ